MAADLFSLLDELARWAEWDVCIVPPEGAPRFHMRFRSRNRGVILGDGVELTELSLERFRQLRAGSPRIEAQGPQGTEYNLVPLEHMALSWRLDRARRRLAILDRDRNEIAVYFNPRVVGDSLEQQVSAWVKAELEAGKAVKPDDEDTRARCSDAVGFEVGRKLLRDARRKFAARGRGRPRKTERNP